MKRNTSFSFWGFIVVAVLLVIFAVQNAQEVSFKFFIWRSHLSLSVLLIVAFLLGLISGAIFLFRNSRATEKEKTHEKNIAEDKKWSTPYLSDENEDTDNN